MNILATYSRIWKDLKPTEHEAVMAAMEHRMNGIPMTVERGPRGPRFRLRKGLTKGEWVVDPGNVEKTLAQTVD